MDVVTDREALVAALRRHGVNWLAPSDAAGEGAIDPVALIASLAVHPDPRLRSALTGLVLLQPRLAAVVADALEQLEQPEDHAGVVELVARYMAAVYLQRRWRTRLELYQRPLVDLPDLYSARVNLPQASAGFGKPGLHALAEWHQRETGTGFNRLAEYNREFEHVIASLKTRMGAHEPARLG
jgi:hypothetical protein